MAFSLVMGFTCDGCGCARPSDSECDVCRTKSSKELHAQLEKNRITPTPADRIAWLEAELAEARGVSRQCTLLGHTQKVGGFCVECSPHRSPRERLEAAQERAFAKDDALRGMTDTANQSVRLLDAECAAHAATKATLADVEARLLAARGEAAAMREAIKEEVLGDAYDEDWPQCVRALATDAGRAIADRVPLWRELEALVRSLSGGVIPVGCLIDVVLRKLAALDAKGGNQ